MASVQATPDMSGQPPGQGQLPANLNKEQVAQIFQVGHY